MGDDNGQMPLPAGATLVDQSGINLPPGATLVSGGDRNSPGYWDALKDKYGLPRSVDLSKTLVQNFGNLSAEDMNKVDLDKFGQAYAEANPQEDRKGFFSNLYGEAKNLFKGLTSPPDTVAGSETVGPKIEAVRQNPANAIPVVGPVGVARANQFKKDPWGALGAGVTDTLALAAPVLLDRFIPGESAAVEEGAKPKLSPKQMADASLKKPIQVTTDSNGTRWASNGTDKVSIPKSVGDADAKAYAVPKLQEQAQGRAQLFQDKSVTPAAPQKAKVTPIDQGASSIASKLGIVDGPPTDLLTRAIKPLSSNSGWDRDIARAIPDLKAAETDIGKPIGGVDDALHAAAVAKKKIWSQYQAKLKTAAAPAAGDDLSETAGQSPAIDGNAVADAMMKSIDKRTVLQNPGLVERIQNIADTYRRPMSLEEAEDFLQSANNDLHSYYAKNKVGQQVAARDPETGHVVAEADALRQQLYSKLDELTGPGAADLKQRYGALSNVENELLRRKNVAARQNPQSLAEQLSMARAYGKIAVGVARMSPSSLLEGTESLAASKFLKERNTTDAMITRAFAKSGQRSKAPVVPAGLPSGVAAAAAAGMSGGPAAAQQEQ